MTNRASLVLTRNRAPPIAGARPAKQSEYPRSITSSNPTEEIAIAIAELQELDRTMTRIDHEITQIESKLGDPSLDEWDRMEIEPTLDALIDQQSKARFNLLFACNRVTHFGAYLIGEWREVDLDNIARHLSQTDGLFARVAQEWPGVLERPEWQRLYQEAAPF